MSSRATKAYASAYDRSSAQVGQLRRGETRRITVDFTQPLEGETITEAVWRTNCPSVLAMSSGSIVGSIVSITGAFQLGGRADLKVTVETSGGRQLVQIFDFSVRDYPTFDESSPTAGPYTLTVTP